MFRQDSLASRRSMSESEDDAWDGAMFGGGAQCRAGSPRPEVVPKLNMTKAAAMRKRRNSQSWFLSYCRNEGVPRDSFETLAIDEKRPGSYGSYEQTPKQTLQGGGCGTDWRTCGGVCDEAQNDTAVVLVDPRPAISMNPRKFLDEP
mmetsp:Transcript_55689/g.156244  ORF Transcript_55689/g.156244 Transcript_55689/m.156244 type:complete len:147 (+) Transcript_55689:142-582(+)